MTHALALLAQATHPGVTLTPGLLALLGLLVAALGALLGGGAAWGRFAATLEQLRADHADLRAEVRKGQADGAQLAAVAQRVADQAAEIKALRDARHDHAAALARLAERQDALASRVGHLDDDVRASRHPSPR
jgi:hypothetical protein